MFLKKSYGQHLLIAQPTVEKIVRILAPQKNDAVLEIGPGTGNLTKHLLRQAGQVIAVEKDKDMVEALKSLSSDNLKVIHSDILDINLREAFSCDRSNTLFCGNLPYNISTPILFKLRDNRDLFDRGLVMIQKEVAERLVAKPGSKDYGILSIMMQVSANIEKCFDVSPKSFVPPPKVMSTVVKISFSKTPPYTIKNEKIFASIVKSTFNTRRKMIRNSIPEEYFPALEISGISPTARPEDLSIGDFIKLADAVS